MALIQIKSPVFPVGEKGFNEETLGVKLLVK